MQPFFRRCSLSLLCIAILASAAGCRKDDPPSPSAHPPAASVPVPIENLYHLRENWVMCEVRVEQVLKHTYPNPHGYNTPVLICSLLQSFYPEREITEPSTIALWVDMPSDPSVQTALKEMFLASDSLIIHGKEMTDHRYSPDSALGKTWLSEENQGDTPICVTTDFGSAQKYLDLPPCVYIPDLQSWNIFPIKDGVFDAKSIIDILEPIGHSMSYSVDGSDAYYQDYFIDGASTEEMYDSVRKFVRK